MVVQLRWIARKLRMAWVLSWQSKRLVFDRLMLEAKRLWLFTYSSVNEICYQLGQGAGLFQPVIHAQCGDTGGVSVAKGAKE